MVRDVVQKQNPAASYHPQLKVLFTGHIAMAVDEQKTIQENITPGDACVRDVRDGGDSSVLPPRRAARGHRRAGVHRRAVLLTPAQLAPKHLEHQYGVSYPIILATA